MYHVYQFVDHVEWSYTAKGFPVPSVVRGCKHVLSTVHVEFAELLCSG
jgi:hypothetical protein